MAVPVVTAANPIDGNHVEVFFSEIMADVPNLVAPASYSIVGSPGLSPTITGVAAGVPSGLGYTSVIIEHSGTTLGGTYAASVIVPLQDVHGDAIVPPAGASFIGFAPVTTYTVTPVGFDVWVAAFSENLYVNPSLTDSSSYSATADYPILPVVTDVSVASPSTVFLEVERQTSLSYTMLVTDASFVDFDGTEDEPDTSFGTGTSENTDDGFSLSKAAGDVYGWDWAGDSRFLSSDLTLRADFVIDTSATTLTPSLGVGNVVEFGLSFNGEEFFVRLNSTSVSLVSGGFSTSAPVSWFGATKTISFLRNNLAGLVAVLVDDVPVISSQAASLTNPATFSEGIRIGLLSGYAVQDFVLVSATVTASETLFTAAGNFLHNVPSTFVGVASATDTVSVIRTEYGPLVKNWGDATPATINDVEVRIDGTPISLASVNPYMGEITPTVPVPKFDVGDHVVEIDYVWFPNPVMPMAGLNTPGLLLNQWTQERGQSANPAYNVPYADGPQYNHRFMMSSVIGPFTDRARPIQIGYRYVAFERAYSALLNSPTTLLLNQSPYSSSQGVLGVDVTDIVVSYEGRTSVPTAANPPWFLTGTDTGYLGSGTDLGYYVLVNESNGAFYQRDEPVNTYQNVATLATRFSVSDYEPDGVYSGVSFGVHSDRYLALVGCLEINGVKHVGFLLDPELPYEQTAWDIVAEFDITILNSTTFTTSNARILESIFRGGFGNIRMQIFDGDQAGVYTVTGCPSNVQQGTATLTVSPAFPANPNTEGNKHVQAYLELDWQTDTINYQLSMRSLDGTAVLSLGGRKIAGIVYETQAIAAAPAYTTLLLSTDKEGSFFWGSVSRAANNTSRWAFVRYAVSYDQASYQSEGITVDLANSTLPSVATPPWFVTEDFGYTTVPSSAPIIVKDTASSAVFDTAFAYARVEPFLTTQTLIDVEASLSVDFGVAGIEINNADRIARLDTLLYRDGVGSGESYRRLVELPLPVSITAFRNPTLDGWTLASGTAVNVVENRLVSTSAFQYNINVSDTALDYTTSRIIEARFKAAATGALFGCRFDTGGRDISLSLTSSPQRVRVSSNGSLVAQYGFTWNDNRYHTYRAVCDAQSGNVTIYADETVLGTIATTSFSAVGNPTLVYFGQTGTSQTTWASMYGLTVPPADTKRTFGIKTRYNEGINSYGIPRTDSTGADNSSVDAVIEEMDWRSTCDVILRLDPQWGAVLYRPDEALPPYYDGDHTNPFTEPSAGWINVEYINLPVTEASFGRVSFGGLDRTAIGQHRWDDVSYRIYSSNGIEFVSNRGMVLNRYNVVTSSEYINDTTLDVYTIESLDSRRVWVASTDVYAARVYQVVVEGSVLASTAWSFDPESQIITFDPPLPQDHTLVTVSFTAGRPITLTYLCDQPLLASADLLNIGTPIFAMSQTAETVVTETTVDGFPYVEFSDAPDTYYNEITVCTKDDGNPDLPISIACNAWVAMELAGTMFSDSPVQEGGAGRGWGSMIARDNVGNFPQTSIFYLGGNNYTFTPNLGVGVLYPSYPSIGNPGGDSGSIVRSFTMTLWMSSVLIDSVTSVPLIDDVDVSAWNDNVPPTYFGPVPFNPSGTPGTTGNGAVIVEMVNYAADGVSRLGPWGGITALSIDSLLNDGFVLFGGSPLNPPVTTTMVIESAN